LKAKSTEATIENTFKAIIHISSALMVGIVWLEPYDLNNFKKS
jgi:hypothetical protein